MSAYEGKTFTASQAKQWLKQFYEARHYEKTLTGKAYKETLEDIEVLENTLLRHGFSLPKAKQ